MPPNKYNLMPRESRRKKMSGTVNYPKVIDHLTDVIKELNVPCAEPPAAEPSAAERQADTAALLRGLLNTLESHDADARAAGAAAAEHGATEAATGQTQAAADAFKQFIAALAANAAKQVNAAKKTADAAKQVAAAKKAADAVKQFIAAQAAIAAQQVAAANAAAAAKKVISAAAQ